MLVWSSIYDLPNNTFIDNAYLVENEMIDNEDGINFFLLLGID